MEVGEAQLSLWRHWKIVTNLEIKWISIDVDATGNEPSRHKLQGHVFAGGEVFGQGCVIPPKSLIAK